MDRQETNMAVGLSDARANCFRGALRLLQWKVWPDFQQPNATIELGPRSARVDLDIWLLGTQSRPRGTYEQEGRGDRHLPAALTLLSAPTAVLQLQTPASPGEVSKHEHLVNCHSLVGTNGSGRESVRESA
jgi:hypothetical protein